MPKKLSLAHTPTPFFHSNALDSLCGAEVWVKRDDMSAGPEAGNKVRKLEYLLADALERGADTIITCGAAQSNHARATALVGASLGLRSVLLLRTADPRSPPKATGNLLLDHLAGSEIRFITPAQYAGRAALLEATRVELEKQGRRAYVVPEGGSNGLGAFGYVDAMREIREQLDQGLAGGPRPFDVIVHACGSGGTAAGVAIGAKRYDVAKETHAVAVCDDRRYFDEVCGRIAAEALALDPGVGQLGPLLIRDEWKGPAYGIATFEQLALMRDVTRASGLVLDPVYTGKAFFGLTRLDPKPKRILFVHTGGLPGLLAAPDVFDAVLAGD